ncbi:MAG TPA: rhomboid family intramembrane serine protease [Planctomycetes bacterium]|nr:rhomboid family intramembrane serine protease [Planctomycetota bacterium]
MIPIRDDAPRPGIPVFVPLLILANVLVFLWTFDMDEELRGPFFENFGLVPKRFFEGLHSQGGFAPLWKDSLRPLFSSMFLHAGPMHLLGNMVFLWVYGDNVELRLGRLRFLLFYFLCGLAAAGFHLAFESGKAVPVVGASGAIAGVLGAYLLLFPKAHVLMLVPVFFFITFIELPAWALLLSWFALQLPPVQGLLGFLEVHGVAYWAHVGGFAAGCLLLPLFLLGSKGGGKKRKQKRS